MARKPKNTRVSTKPEASASAAESRTFVSSRITFHCRICGLEVAAGGHCPEHPDVIVDSILGPRSAPDLAEAVALARKLISLASEQTRQAQSNLDLAKVGLAEIEIELVTRGIPPVGGAS